ncbi:hypothetical protein RRX38_20865 [Pseudomonas sp. DTU_2021_1001937_2_SI_NGA_ILE_001]|uniref:hypothetical protein n=1 Tax=Pseudomonas sp. DTU_2021_1001937_2_SI_NGA_ILE_001 TaxID=3077589 RepID=UPI0028FC1AAF|nr:hypothetical protein [Pseudomonas sp. DTU_2021_1001937_2_SI_NGA_ILE_001]WNW13505.1 hypothetical protein RRX38_20865 [Pseudomonas sp. DTU_2021_1001937_2_SI_NGA_ILE_001]
MIHDIKALSVSLPITRPAQTTTATAVQYIEPLANPSYDGLSLMAQHLSRAASSSWANHPAPSLQQARLESARLLAPLTDETYRLNKSVHDSEIPATQDREWLERARQATGFLEGRAGNPFHELSRPQLALISWDDSQTFTINERRAAWLTLKGRQDAQQHRFAADAQKELATTGRVENTLKQALTHYRQLSVMEQAQHPEGYIERLEKALAQAAGSEGAKRAHLDTPARLEALLLFNTDAAGKTATASDEVLSVPQTKDTPGYKTLVERLYGKFEHPVMDTNRPRRFEDIGRGFNDYLTQADRFLFARFYEYAQEQGAELQYVDRLAWELGEYRSLSHGRTLINQNDGTSRDQNGHRLTFSYTPENAEIINRIRSSEAFKTTLLDTRFLEFAFDPGFRPFSNGSDKRFLEQMVTRFSAQGSKDYALDARFAHYDHDPKTKDKIVHRSSHAERSPRWEPMFVSTKDGWAITAKGKAAGFGLDPVSGGLVIHTPSAMPAPKTDENMAGWVQQRVKKASLLHPFMMMVAKYKAQGRVRRP